MVTQTRKQRLSRRLSLFLPEQERQQIGVQLDLFFEGKIKRKDLIGFVSQKDLKRMRRR